MNAAEARKLSEQNVSIVAKRQADFEKQQAAEKKAELKFKRKLWRDGFEERVRLCINSAVKNGKVETMVELSNSTSHPYQTFQHLETFHTFFEYPSDLKIVLRHLKHDGFKTEVTKHSYEVDETIAYANSGGESGSPKPYRTSDIVLLVSW